ncbi:hypothetical protein IJ103_02505 [Candidatus Saccharibacteria bacterium]|nr:hypothetical protein [Candidatus Saccharibacteria bacterium]
MGNSKLIKILLFGIPIYIIIAIALIIFFAITNQPYYGEQTNINNLTSTPETAEVLNIIKYNLYQAIGYNSSVNPADVNDVTIRENSQIDTYDESTKLHHIFLIVDIPSLRQSYQVNYQWTEDENVELNEWGTSVTCPTTDQLIYEPFNCQDMFTTMDGSNDPIMKILPYYGPRFEITAKTADNKVTSVDIKLLTCIDSSLPSYESEAKNWLKRQGIDLNNYRFDITSCE